MRDKVYLSEHMLVLCYKPKVLDALKEIDRFDSLKSRYFKKTDMFEKLFDYEKELGLQKIADAFDVSLSTIDRFKKDVINYVTDFAEEKQQLLEKAKEKVKVILTTKTFNIAQ